MIIRRIFIAAVLSTVIVVSGWLAGLVPIKDTHGFEEYLLLLTVVLFWPMVILWVSYIDGKLYLRNLKTAGFEVPADRRKYENKLANLPRFKELVIENTGRNKGSLLLTFFACLGAVIFLLILTDYVWKGDVYHHHRSLYQPCTCHFALYHDRICGKNDSRK